MSLQRSETVFGGRYIKRPRYDQSIVMYLWSLFSLSDLITRATATRLSPFLLHSLLATPTYLPVYL